ncbi:ABC transporter permease [Candidatus Dependentiae bacterium]|nr:ABC transporter permease [Candidatus Dependentiae bacterium]
MDNFKNTLKKQVPFFFGSLSFIWQCLFFYLPLIFILIFSFIQLKNGHLSSIFTLEYYQALFQFFYFKIIFKSLILALFIACTCLLIAYPVTYFITMRTGKFKIFFLFLLIVPFWTNFLLHVYSWFFVLERNGFLNTLFLKLGLISEPIHFLNSMFAVIIVMIYCYLPFAVLPLYSILEKFDRKLIEASLDLGASNWQTFKLVTLPLTMEGIRSGFFLVFVPSFGEFVIPDLVGGSKSMFVGSVISHFTLGANTINYGAAFTMISSIILVFMLFVIFKTLRHYGKTGQ